MQRRITLHGIGAIIAICFGSWIACNNGTGPSTVPEPVALLPPASLEVDALSTVLATVTETAALTFEKPPWHDCLHDDGGNWQTDDGRRCVPIQFLNTFTGWHPQCGHNTAYFSSPDYQCCIDDGLGQCVPGSEQSYTASPEEPEVEEPEVEEPEVEEPEVEEPEVEEPEEVEEPPDPDVWIYGTSPPKDMELCEGDYIHVIGIRRSDSAGELRGSVYLVDPEMEDRIDLEKTADTLQYVPIEGSFRFADGEDSIVTYDLDEKRIGRCPDCGEKRDVVLGINDLIYTEDDGTDPGSYRIGDAFVFQVRKTTDELCQPE